MQKDATENAEHRPGRRRFLGMLWLGLGFAAIAEIIWVIVSFFRPRKGKSLKGGPGAIVRAGTTKDFAPNTVTAFPRGQFYLARLEDGGFLAVSRTCTHLGCTVPWVDKEKRFACPCHASAFDITGDVINAPAPRALDLFPITIENHVLKVNTGKRIKRSGFQASQVTYSKDR
ncbi:ubiquinol-cytochrome c reductase iron-sulfur subunit [Thermodesulfobacteriota bacterium]